jgi:hypothetical protein
MLLSAQYPGLDRPEPFSPLASFTPCGATASSAASSRYASAAVKGIALALETIAQ